MEDEKRKRMQELKDKKPEDWTEEDKRFVRDIHVEESYDVVHELINLIKSAYEVGVTTDLPRGREMSINVVTEILLGALVTATLDGDYVREVVKSLIEETKPEELDPIIVKMDEARKERENN